MEVCSGVMTDAFSASSVGTQRAVTRGTETGFTVYLVSYSCVWETMISSDVHNSPKLGVLSRRLGVCVFHLHITHHK